MLEWKLDNYNINGYGSSKKKREAMVCVPLFAKSITSKCWDSLMQTFAIGFSMWFSKNMLFYLNFIGDMS